MSSCLERLPTLWAALLIALLAGSLGCDAAATPEEGAPAADTGVDEATQDVSADPFPDVEAPEWGDAGPDAAEPSEPTEPVVNEDPAAPYLPIPTGKLGGDRPAEITLPDDYDPAVPWPLVMLLHGYSANGFIQDYYLGIGERVDARDFIYIVPEGTVDATGKQFWNALPGCCNWYGSTVDDFGYLIGLLEEAMEKYHVDRSRVVLIGHSNGGYMSHRIACDRSDLVTAIASIAGTSFGDMDLDCAASHPVSVLQIHGTADATVSYYTPFAGVGAEATTSWWAERAGCEDGVTLADRDYDKAVFGSETDPTRWTGCDDDVTVELWKMVATGHIPIFNELFAEDALTFLLEHPRPPGPSP